MKKQALVHLLIMLVSAKLVALLYLSGLSSPNLSCWNVFAVTSDTVFKEKSGKREGNESYATVFRSEEIPTFRGKLTEQNGQCILIVLTVHFLQVIDRRFSRILDPFFLSLRCSLPYSSPYSNPQLVLDAPNSSNDSPAGEDSSIFSN